MVPNEIIFIYCREFNLLQFTKYASNFINANITLHYNTLFELFILQFYL